LKTVIEVGSLTPLCFPAHENKSSTRVIEVIVFMIEEFAVKIYNLLDVK
jgi:hypothetical protein